MHLSVRQLFSIHPHLLILQSTPECSLKDFNQQLNLPPTSILVRLHVRLIIITLLHPLHHHPYKLIWVFLHTPVYPH